MPKAATAKSKPRIPGPPSSSPAPSIRPKKPTLPGISKEIILQIVLARMEDTKTFDWVGLAEKVNVGGVTQREKGKKRKSEEDGYSGNDLREIYNNVIVPSIRAGNNPWEAIHSPSPPSSPAPTTPQDQATPALVIKKTVKLKPQPKTKTYGKGKAKLSPGSGPPAKKRQIAKKVAELMHEDDELFDELADDLEEEENDEIRDS